MPCDMMVKLEVKNAATGQDRKTVSHMETTIKDRFAVVQDDFELENWQVAAELLTEIVGVRAVSAKQRTRNSHGFLAHDLPEDLAQRLRDACAEHGIGVQLVPQSEVIPVIKPARMHQVWIAEDSLRLRASHVNVIASLGWETVRLIALTRTTKKESFQHWDTAERRAEVVTHRVTSYTEEFPEYLADLFAFQPNDQVLGVRFLSRELNYAEALGNLAPDVLVDVKAREEGFRLLLFAIVSRSAQAYVSPESAALLTALPLRLVRSPPPVDLNHFDAFNRWLLQRLRQGARVADGGLR
jgi:hypothetical protein